MDELKTAALDHLEVSEVAGEKGRELVATVMAPRTLEDDLQERVARTLADRLEEAAERRGLTVRGADVTGVTLDTSDQADCEDLEGRTVNAFTSGQLCYRLVAYLTP